MFKNKQTNKQTTSETYFEFENNSRNCITFSKIYRKNSYEPSKIKKFWLNMENNDYFSVLVIEKDIRKPLSYEELIKDMQPKM